MTTHVLILCTHNTTRSLMAEAMLNHWARRLHCDVRAHSGGSTPGAGPNPLAIETLHNAGIDTRGLHSKSWDVFAQPGAPRMSVAITVCDRAATEDCPLFHGGAPVEVHWHYPDPWLAEGSIDHKRRLFELTRQALSYRMLQLLSLPLGSMAPQALRKSLADIGAS